MNKSYRVFLLSILCIVCLRQGAFSQKYYMPQQYSIEQPGSNLFGILGVLYNPVPYPVLLEETSYHGPANFYGTAYLLNPIEEFDGIHPLLPLSPYYTSGVAMCSVKWPELRLFAPIEVASVIYDPEDPFIDKYLPFASIATTWPENGPFNTLSYLNDPPNGFKHPVKSVFATSILEATQKFTQFTHDLYDWNGLDKEGNKCITTIIDFNHQGTTMYNHHDTLIYHRIATYTPELPSVSRDLISHELSHGILHHVPSLGKEAYDGYADNPIPLHALMESFCDIMGLSMMNFYEIENGGAFNKPNWRYGLHQDNGYGGSVRPFNKPKNFGNPSTYNGKNFLHVSNPNYAPQSNGMVGDYWFYLLASGERKEGYIDDNVALGKFEVLPLVSNDKFNSYKLTLDIVFKTFTSGKVTLASDYPDLRKQTLATVVEMGYPVGSYIYRQVMNAWHAVGVGTPWSNSYNVDCLPAANALSYYNGDVLIPVQKSTLDQNSTSELMFTLNGCSEIPGIQTLVIDPETLVKTPLIDGDMNGIFSYENDEALSKIGVSIHKFTSVSSNWFKNRFGHLGPDGGGSFKITSVIEPYDGLILYPAFDTSDSVFYYQNEGRSANRDEISRQYFLAINAFLKHDPNKKTAAPEWQTLREGLAGIFSLAIKRDYETEAQNPDAQSIWVLNEDLEDPASMMDFSQPKLYGQPAVYNGANWSSNPRNNTGFINLFYYLLTHGTEDANGQDLGYTDPELGGKIYFVNKMDKDLVLRVLWEAYRSISLNASIEEFRQATLTALHSNPQYHPKSKEHIAFHDAWAAVLGLPDYASGLAHSPEEDEVVYPWPVKVGVESEYPMYESYRLFEVSKSGTFNESEHPVHRFVSNTAPDFNTSKIYGQVNLEPGQKYFVRSHLADGPEARQHCAGTDDPHFCESLLNKKKWTLPYPFQTEGVPAPLKISPAKGQVISAWTSPISFGSVKGALGYDIHVTDLLGTVPEQNMPVDVAFDEDNVSKPVKTFLALSKDKPYSYNVAARQRLGSEWAVHVLPGGMLTLLTEDEKAQFPNTYGEWNEVMDFKTDIPFIKLHSPANGAHVPIFGVDTTVRAKKEFPQLADYYQYSFREPFYTDKALELDSSFAHYPISIQGLIGLEDKKSYEWTFIQRKKVTPPFIMEEEEGASPGWFTFIVDKDLVPAPELEPISCVDAGSPVKVFWKEVPGAQSYKVTVINAGTQQTASWQTGYTGTTITGASTFPNKYIYKVSAGVQGANGDWIFGKEAEGKYSVIPPPPSNLSPDNVSGVQLGSNNSVQLSWTMPPGVTDVRLFAEVENGSGLIDTEVNGSTFTLNDLPFNKNINWFVSSIGLDKSCESKEVSATFQTEEEPAEFDFGFEVRVDNNDPKIQGGFYHYGIKVTRPDGTVDFTGVGTVDADTWLQVGFVPEEGQVINGNELNGQLTDQQGDYLIELEILDMAQCSGCENPNEQPQITIQGQEYIRKPGESAWKLNKSVQPQPNNPVFPSRTIGAKKVIKLHYNLPN